MSSGGCSLTPRQPDSPSLSCSSHLVCGRKNYSNMRDSGPAWYGPHCLPLFQPQPLMGTKLDFNNLLAICSHWPVGDCLPAPLPPKVTQIWERSCPPVCLPGPALPLPSPSLKPTKAQPGEHQNQRLPGGGITSAEGREACAKAQEVGSGDECGQIPSCSGLPLPAPVSGPTPGLEGAPIKAQVPPEAPSEG